jgi:hypothetical protein
MAQGTLSAEVVISIIFGILQLVMGLVSLWQQHYFRWAARKPFILLTKPQELTR